MHKSAMILFLMSTSLSAQWPKIPRRKCPEHRMASPISHLPGRAPVLGELVPGPVAGLGDAFQGHDPLGHAAFRRL